MEKWYFNVMRVVAFFFATVSIAAMGICLVVLIMAALNDSAVIAFTAFYAFCGSFIAFACTGIILLMIRIEAGVRAMLSHPAVSNAKAIEFEN